MTIDSQRQLAVLDAVHHDAHVTQRHLSTKLGIALGLTNVYLKRLAREGYIDCIRDQPQRLRYVITSKGLATETRLRHELLLHSLHMYRDVRQQLSSAIRGRVGRNHRIAVFGTDEAAELVYLSLKEQGLDPVAIFASEGGGTFLGMEIRGLDECKTVAFDRLVVANVEMPATLIEELNDAGIAPDRLLTLTSVLAEMADA
jgi:predicted transcriptional regulator